MPPQKDVKTITEFIQMIRLQIPFVGYIKVSYRDTERYLYVKTELLGCETILPIDKSNKPVEWFKSNDTQRILRIINGLKCGEESVDLKRLFSDFPRGSGGVHLMGEVPIGDSIIPIYMNIGLFGDNTTAIVFNSPQTGRPYKFFDPAVYINGHEKKEHGQNGNTG